MADPPIRYGVQVTDLTRLARDLKAVSDDTVVGFRQMLRSSMDPVLGEIAGKYAGWSTRIGPTVRVGMTGGRANVRVFIRAGGAGAPHAAAYENKGQEGTFRHKVFGHNVWVSERARPTLWPTVSGHMDELANTVESGIDEYLRKHGL